MQRHIIHKQKVSLRVSKREDVHFFQSRVSEMLQNELNGEVESLLDELFPSDKIIRIDLLQLDLGDLNQQNFDQEFKNEFIKALAKSLSSKKDDLDISNNSEVLSKARSLVNSFIYFLEKGYLPWYSAVEKTVDWENDLLNNLSANEYTYFLDWLRDNYQHNPVITERLILQFSDTLLAKLLSVDAPAISESWIQVYKDYAYLVKNYLKGEYSSRVEIWKCLFYVLLNNKDELWAFRVLKLLADHFGIKGSSITIVKEDDINRQLKTAIVKDAFNELTEFLKARNGNETNKWKRVGNNAEAQFDALYDNGKELTSGWSRGEKKKWEAEEEEGLYVNNCGIVILHFFLRPFFEDLKLVTEGKFPNEKNQQRAVLLLHYLATGEVEVAEFDLALQKILCGYPLENTLPTRITLTPKEKTETKKLLNTVIDYWEPLKGTSIEGLRDTFLHRGGKLIKNDNGWQLIVEQKTVDILLGKIPWGFSTILLPWMDQMLNVDWY